MNVSFAYRLPFGAKVTMESYLIRNEGSDHDAEHDTETGAPNRAISTAGQYPDAGIREAAGYVHRRRLRCQSNRAHRQKIRHELYYDYNPPSRRLLLVRHAGTERIRRPAQPGQTRLDRRIRSGLPRG